MSHLIKFYAETMKARHKISEGAHVRQYGAMRIKTRCYVSERD